MKKDFIAFTDKGTAVANLAITKALRLQQILSGFLILDDGTINVFKDNNRAEVLADIVADLVPFEKIIVWSIFKQDYVTIRKICSDLKLKYAEVTGEISDKQKEIDMFEKDPECRVMIASQAAGGVGVNMIEASTMIYYSKGYSLEHDLQSEARNYRGGSEKHKKITRIDLVARGTVDEIVNKALKDKSDLAKDITKLRDLLIRN
jgi:SNF2 family DNA or RNA helicase